VVVPVELQTRGQHLKPAAREEQDEDMLRKWVTTIQIEKTL